MAPDNKKKVSADELQQHASPEKCWLLVNGTVWDLSEFAPDHPGGVDGKSQDPIFQRILVILIIEAVIYRHAGRDASTLYNSIHSSSLLENELGSSKKIGYFKDGSPSGSSHDPSPAKISGESMAVAPISQPRGRRPLQTIISTHDFEQAASENLSAKAWAFFSSAATDCITKQANEAYFDRIWLRPRIMKDVKDIRYDTKMLGVPISMPLFASPTAMAKLAHQDGELAIAKGCSKFGIPQTISTNASFPISEITSSVDNAFFQQLYVNKDRAASEKLLQQAEACGMRAVFVTVDQPTPGKREADERVKAEGAVLTPTPNGATASNDRKGSGLGRTMSGFIDSTLNWEDIKWLRKSTKLPIVLKGVQTAEDVILAVEYGIDGLLLGNHGGRSLDTSPPSIMILLELHHTCPDVFNHIEIFLDGGIRRGTDMFKALCLGARAVGMGRHFLYAANYGAEGVEQLIEIMQEEFETTMRMMGCTDLSQLHPGLLNLCDVKNWSDGLSPLVRSKL